MSIESNVGTCEGRQAGDGGFQEVLIIDGETWGTTLSEGISEWGRLANLGIQPAEFAGCEEVAVAREEFGKRLRLANLEIGAPFCGRIGGDCGSRLVGAERDGGAARAFVFDWRMRPRNAGSIGERSYRVR